MKRSFFASPYLVWMTIFIVAPIALIIWYAVTNMEGALTLENFIRFFDPIYADVLWKSIWMAFICTLICLLIGYPAALWLSDRGMDKSGILSVLFIIPMWMNFLLRTYAWMSLLESSGIIAQAVNGMLGWFGIDPIRLLYNDGAVMLGMVYNFLPFMILPIHSVVGKIDRRIIEAAEDLGANGWSVFRRVKLPLSVPGIVSGVTMVFMPAITTFVISVLMGGGKSLLFGDLIEQQFLFVGDWNFGSALSVIMMILILVSLGVLNRFEKSDEGGVW